MRQLEAFAEYGVPQKNIYCDKKTGKNFERKNYCRLIKRLHSGDLLVIKSIDRLGRNYSMIIEEWSRITRKIRADILVLDMPLLDTRRGKDLLGTFLADVVLQILSFVAENERENIRQRQAEGIAAAKARGVQFGRPSKPLPENFYAVHRTWRSGQITLRQAAELCHMNHNTFYYRARRYEDEQRAQLMVRDEVPRTGQPPAEGGSPPSAREEGEGSRNI